MPFSRPALVLYFLVVTLLGFWAADRAEAILGGKDPGVIVIDEVAGMTLAVLGLVLIDVPLTWARLAAAFVLFRLFDVLKPPPAHRFQELPGGRGVMLDDLVAGVYAFLALALIRGLTEWP